MNWEELQQAAPELTEQGEGLFDRSGVVLLGAIRKDGWPCISPVEPVVHQGNLYLGMMWRSLKALDLLRDPRCTVNSTIADRHATGGGFKLHGRAADVRDRDERRR